MKTFLYLITLLFISQPIEAQQIDSTSLPSKADSAIISQYHQKIKQFEALRIEDSIQREQLNLQINSLKTTDNLKKEALQAQLEALDLKEQDRIAEKRNEIDLLRNTNPGYPVLGFFQDTLFNIYSNLGSFSALDRSIAIQKRIKELGEIKYDSVLLRKISKDDFVHLYYKDRILMSISENDAIWNSTDRNTLATNYLAVIHQEITKYTHETSLVELLKEIGLALLVLVITYWVIKYLLKFFRFTAFKIVQQKDKKIKGIKIRNYTLFDAQRQVNALVSLNTFLKWMVLLLVVYIALPILFGIFPWTRNLGETLFGYILNPLEKIAVGIFNFLPNLFTIGVIIIVFRYVLRGLKFLKTEIELEHLKLPGFYPDWASPTYQIFRVLVVAFMIVVIFPYLPGSDSPIFKGVSVFLGFLFTFGSAGSLSNLISGIILTYMRLYKIGDRIKIGNTTGDVIEKNILVTRLRTIKNEIISVPNSTVMSSHTINYSVEAQNNGLIVHTTVTIGYDVPWKLMHEALLEAANRTDLVLKDPKPFVLQTSLNDFYVSYEINAYTKNPNQQALIYSNLHSHIQDCCNERGIEIMSPHYMAARDGNAKAVPEEHLPKDYKIPGFNINNNSQSDL